MSTAHFILQGKGGVGKSMIAALLYQYFDYKNVDIRAIDTDPQNHSLAAYKNFNVETLEIVDENKDIDASKWDRLIDICCDEVPEHGHVIIDNGASSFMALKKYFKTTDLFQILQDEGVQTYVHCVVVGGDPLEECIKGIYELNSLLNENVKFIVWINPYFGKVQANGMDVSEFDVFKNPRLSNFVYLPYADKQTLGHDLYNLFTFKTSLNDAIKSDQTHRAVKSRLKRYRDNIFSTFDALASHIGIDIIEKETPESAAENAEEEKPIEENATHYEGPLPDENLAAESAESENNDVDNKEEGEE